MPVHAGTRVQETGTFHCRDCDAKVRVKKGERLPDCPCGSNLYTSRYEGAAEAKCRSVA